MPLNLYGGNTGSGKTYQVVCNIIVPQIAKGRHIITTIRNVRIDDIKEYLLEDESVEPDDLGELTVVTGDQVRQENFFPVYVESEEKFDDSQSIVKCGQMVILDEAERYFSRDEPFTKRTRQFFAEHRHAVNPDNGQSCDIILMCPDLMDLRPTLRRRPDASFVCMNLKHIGRPKSYTVHQYIGGKITGKPQSTSSHNYDPLFFKFYDSYQGGTSGKEALIDKRQNLLGGPIKMLIASVVLLILGGFFIYRFLNPPARKPVATAGQTASQPSSQQIQMLNEKARSDRRVSAWFSQDNKPVLYVDSSDAIEPKFKGKASFNGRHVTLDDDGRTITSWTRQQTGITEKMK